MHTGFNKTFGYNSTTEEVYVEEGEFPSHKNN